MDYQVNSDSWTKISETSGTIQNVDSDYNVEMTNDTLNSGIIIYPHQKHTFSSSNIYLRCTEKKENVTVRVVPFIVDGKGGGTDEGIMIDGEEYHIADSDSFEDRLDEYFPD